MVEIKVKRCKDSYGYELEHNQPIGFKGTTAKRFHWYRFKPDAEKAAKELEKCWNNGK